MDPVLADEKRLDLVLGELELDLPSGDMLREKETCRARYCS